MRIFAFVISVIGVLAVFGFASGAYAGGDPIIGEKIYNSKKAKCKVCHALTAKKKIGPGLASVTNRRSEAWLVKWMHDPQRVWKENDKETREMRKWKKGRGKAKMTTMKMPKLTESEVADLIAFLKRNDGK